MMMLTCYIGVQDEGKYGEHCVDGGVANHEKALVQRHRREVEYGRENCLREFQSIRTVFHTSCHTDLHCGDDQPSVYDKLAEAGRPLVAVSAVDKEQSANMAELKDFASVMVQYSSEPGYITWVIEKSAARLACFPSFPTIPMPTLAA